MEDKNIPNTVVEENEKSNSIFSNKKKLTILIIVAVLLVALIVIVVSFITPKSITGAWELIEKGFDAFIYEGPIERIKKAIAQGEKPSLNLYFAGKNAIADFVSEQDLVITLCDVMNGRPAFGLSKGGGEIPWYVFELPVVGISVNAPTILADIPQFRTYINAYDSKPQTMDALVDNLLSGVDAFKGKDPIDSFCGLWDATI